MLEYRLLKISLSLTAALSVAGCASCGDANRARIVSSPVIVDDLDDAQTAQATPALASAIGPALMRHPFGRDLPDPNVTPGVLNPRVTQGTIRATICRAGWTKTVRPGSSEMRAVKRSMLANGSYAGRPSGEFQLDHLISLQLGGHPDDEENLWLQPYAPRPGMCGARQKDVLETRLKKMVCDGSMALDEAQELIRSNWIEAYRTYVSSGGCQPIDADDEPDTDDDEDDQ